IKGNATRVRYPGREELGRVQPEVLNVAPVKHEGRTANLRQKLAHVQFGQDGQGCAHHLRRRALAHVAGELAGGFPGGPTKNHAGRRLSEELPVLVDQTDKALGLPRSKQLGAPRKRTPEDKMRHVLGVSSRIADGNRSGCEECPQVDLEDAELVENRLQVEDVRIESEVGLTIREAGASTVVVDYLSARR